MARRRVIVGVVAVVAVLGLLWFLFGRGEDSAITPIFGSEPPPVATFAFKSVTPKYTATAVHLDKKKLEKAAKQTIPGVQDTVTKLFQDGYVNPDGWGDTGAIDGLFTDEAAKALESDKNVETLTLGTAAPDAVSTVDPKASKLRVTSLIDGSYAVPRALAEVTFAAKANNTDGSTTKIKVTGTLFLVPDGDNWKIEAFHLSREDRPHAAKTPSVSGASPTGTG